MENSLYPTVIELTICDDGSKTLRINARQSYTGKYRGTRWYHNVSAAQIERVLRWSETGGRHVGSCSAGAAGWYKQVQG